MTVLERLKADQDDPSELFPQFVAVLRTDLAKLIAVAEAAQPFKSFADARPFGAGDECIPQDVELNMRHLRALQSALSALKE